MAYARSAPRRWPRRSGSAPLCDSKGIRAKVATATDIVELERRLGRSALDAHHRRWRSVRGDGGWLTTYWYRPGDITAEKLAHAWSTRADGIMQNITLFGDGTATATVTVRSAQPPTAPPSMMLRTLPGEQAQAVAANLCGPTAVRCAVSAAARWPSPLVSPDRAVGRAARQGRRAVTG